MAGEVRQGQVQSPRYIPQCGGTCLTYLRCRAVFGPGICTHQREAAPFALGSCVPGAPPSMAGFHFHRRAFEAEKRWAKRKWAPGEWAAAASTVGPRGTSRKVHYRQGFAFPHLPDSTSANQPPCPPGRYLCAKRGLSLRSLDLSNLSRLTHHSLPRNFHCRSRAASCGLWGDGFGGCLSYRAALGIVAQRQGMGVGKCVCPGQMSRAVRREERASKPRRLCPRRLATGP